MKLLLHPNYVSLESARQYSPRLFSFMQQMNIPLTVVNWDGTRESLPVEPSLVRWSTMITAYPREILAKDCCEMGHFLFFDDRIVEPDGTLKSENLLPSATAFFQKNGCLSV